MGNIYLWAVHFDPRQTIILSNRQQYGNMPLRVMPIIFSSFSCRSPTPEIGCSLGQHSTLAISHMTSTNAMKDKQNKVTCFYDLAMLPLIVCNNIFTSLWQAVAYNTYTAQANKRFYWMEGKITHNKELVFNNTQQNFKCKCLQNYPPSPNILLGEGYNRCFEIWWDFLFI